jgi:hypothetical protein
MKYPDKAPSSLHADHPVALAIDALRDEIVQRHVENQSSTEVLAKKVETMVQVVDNVMKGFPDGDPVKHREYHESLIAAAKAKEQFYRDLHHDLVKKGVWIVIVVAGGALLRWLQIHFRIVP